MPQLIRLAMLLPAFVFLLLAAVGYPPIDRFPLTKTVFPNASSLPSVDGVGPVTELGVGMWGQCTIDTAGHRSCRGESQVVYNIDLISSSNETVSVCVNQRGEVEARPIALLSLLVGIIASLASDDREINRCSLGMSVAGSFAVFMTFLFDVMFFSSIGNEMHALHDFSKTSLGGAFWLNFAAMLLLLMDGIYSIRLAIAQSNR
ncbi:hypothetical protein SISSUDRAFT_579954 [Sistotremastrum suecicum HHB10207 ss-3]|uniref:Pali-domain-containing protein n=1 Tax=Sistotremastrum suecicum HHB10207 ss-3 TaxID=1314776 RepID=A0A166ENZ3_9AGAM|nr:hypothetical protein SISSUDRAFT_579954 [Sistotremastrum suecicum HHB10207 ss-3]